MKYDIVTIGDAFEDVFAQPDVEARFNRNFTSGRCISFELGEKVPLENVQYEIGGSACNAAVGFSRLGYHTAMVTLLGDDTPKDRVIDRMIAEGVDTDQIIVNDKVKTGFSVIFRVDDNRTIFVYHGVKDYSELRIKKGLKSRWFFVTPLGENTREIENRILSEVSENNSNIAWNPGSIQIEKGVQHYASLLKVTTILFLNKEEGIKFINLPVRPSIEQLLRKLYAYGPKMVVITNGKEGAFAYDGKEIYFRTADQRLKGIDVTGAGDSFATGVIGRLIDKDWKEDLVSEEIEDALRWGTRNSASVIRYVGAQAGLLNKKDINQ